MCLDVVQLQHMQKVGPGNTLLDCQQTGVDEIAIRYKWCVSLEYCAKVHKCTSSCVSFTHLTQHSSISTISITTTSFALSMATITCGGSTHTLSSIATTSCSTTHPHRSPALPSWHIGDNNMDVYANLQLRPQLKFVPMLPTMSTVPTTIHIGCAMHLNNQLPHGKQK